MKNTKRSMLISGLCLLLTAVMLLGSTFAWFTDSVTNEGNVITAGKLSIDAYAYDVGEGGTAVTIEGVNGDEKFTFEEKGQDLKDTTNPTAIINGEINWEPGKSNAKLLTVTNKGSLAANIRLSFDVTDGGLEDALWFDFVRVDENGDVQGQFEKRPMSTLNQLAQSMVMPLKAGETLRFVLVYGMYESADNQFQGKTFSADVTIMATQAAVEEDGFGNPNYDAAADGTPDQDWALGGTTVVTMPATGWAEETTLAVSGVTAVVPDTAIAEGKKELELRVIENREQDESVNLPEVAGQTARYYDISLEGLDAQNNQPVTVTVQLPAHLDEVELYHYDEPVETASYNAETGLLTFTTTSFSPFTVTYLFAGGNGTQEYPYLIASSQDFAAISTLLGAKMQSGQPFHFLQTGDIVVEKSGTYLCGSYNGGGYQAVAGTSTGIKALFRETWGNEAVIENITLVSQPNNPLVAVWTANARNNTWKDITINCTGEGTVYVNANNFGFVVLDALYEGWGYGDAQTYVLENITNNANVQNQGTCTSPFVGSGPCLNEAESTISYQNCVNNGDIIGTSFVGFYYGNKAYIGSVESESMFHAQGCVNNGVLMAANQNGVAEIALGNNPITDAYESISGTGSLVSGSKIADCQFSLYYDQGFQIVGQNLPELSYQLVANVSAIYWEDGYVSNGIKVTVPSQVVTESQGQAISAGDFTVYDRQTALEKGIITAEDVFQEQDQGGYAFAVKVVDGQVYLVLNVGAEGSINSDADHASSVSLHIYAYDENGLCGVKTLG